MGECGVIDSVVLGVRLRYWWVNQKQTYRQELAGGFMWSPKRNANGGRNPYYDFMTEVQPGDLVFSYANGYLIAVGVAMSPAQESSKPKDFGNVGEVWSNDGWRVDVDFTKAENPISPKNHLGVIASLLPDRYSPLQPNGHGNQVYLTSISTELGQVLLGLLGNPDLSWPVVSLRDLSFEQEEQELFRDVSINETVKATLILARRGQGAYRERVRFFEGACRVTGVDRPELLIASHIKPWKTSTNDERVNGHNGLFLSPHVDKLFDSGFISFEDSGEMLVSPQLDRSVLERWSINPASKVRKFRDEQTFFLESHRGLVFKG
jgi:putative restriction endonuclease